MVGEVYMLDPQRVAAYYGNGHDELPLAFNFSFLWSPWDAAAFRAQVDEIEAAAAAGRAADLRAVEPRCAAPPHAASTIRTWGEARARVAAMMLLTLRGTPFLYYGEEIGMRDVPIPTERICDPVGKRFPAARPRSGAHADAVDVRRTACGLLDRGGHLAADWAGRRDRQRRAASATTRARC